MRQIGGAGWKEKSAIVLDSWCLSVCVIVAQSCPTLCDPMDCSLPCFSVHGILQVRILEWVTLSSSRGFSQPRMEPRSPALQADSLQSEPPECLSRQREIHLEVIVLNEKLELGSGRSTTWEFKFLILLKNVCRRGYVMSKVCRGRQEEKVRWSSEKEYYRRKRWLLRRLFI